jgi:hypothetical protein
MKEGREAKKSRRSSFEMVKEGGRGKREEEAG